MKIRHPETGQELDVPEDEDFEKTYRPQGFVPAGEAPADADEAPNLAGMKRADLDAYAAERGVADPGSYPNKEALIEAIEGTGG